MNPLDTDCNNCDGALGTALREENKAEVWDEANGENNSNRTKNSHPALTYVYMKKTT
jgi:hypothetical protein